MKNIGFVVLFLLIAGVEGFSQGQWTVYTEEDGLPSKYIDCITVAPDNSLWIGAGNGFCRFDGKTFETFDFLFDDPTYHYILSIDFSNNGTMWVAAGADGLIKYDGKSWTKYKSGVDSLKGPFYKSVFYAMPAPDGSVWAASGEGSGSDFRAALSHFDGNTWTHYTKDMVGNNLILSYEPIAIAPDGTVWRINRSSVERFDGENWRSLDLSNIRVGIFDNIDVTNDNTVYFGSSSGVIRYKNNIAEIITPDATPHELISEVLSIKSMPDNSIWASFGSAGFGRYDGAEWDFYVYDFEGDHSPDDLAVDNFGNVWLAFEQRGLVKFEPDYTSVENGDISQYKITGNYPNPFNPMTTINYSIASQGHVSLAIHNISGQKVATLVNGEMTSGKHTAQFDGSALASGVYFYRFEAGKFSKTGKMLLVK